MPSTVSRPITKVLIANRGEIALRVVRGCRDAGIRSAAVYSEADTGALHVRQADEANLLGPAAPAESYLNIGRIIEVAQAAGADAIHPGYGFLAENADFAQACAEAGITFIGPSPEAIRLLGDKAAARRTMLHAAIPLVPGTEPITAAQEAVEAAERMGYPVLVKAAGGGGGRGIRAVERPEDLPNALEIAAAEALQAFGDPSVYLEKLLHPVRHVEVQIMADRHGNVVALGERECSVQRRHQKLIEEGPSTAVSPELRREMMEAAVAAARAAGYEGAGTVEFLLDTRGKFYFLEVNTRLQVEHPVTELITGLDLVRDQLRVAMGEPLGYRQEDIHLRGWALECRIVAEDPYNGFLPSLGRARVHHEPSGPGVRLDAGLYDGQEITPYYDSLLAKLLTWGRDRDEAVRRMRRALNEYVITGVKTAIPFHRYVMDTPKFLRGELSTDFVEEVASAFEEDRHRREELAILAAAVLADGKGGSGAPQGAAARASDGTGNGRSNWVNAFRPQPWSRGGWR